MDDARWTAIERLFEAALGLPAGERGAFLERETDDAALRAEVLGLLDAHDSEGPFDRLAHDVASLSADPPAAAEPVHTGRRFGPYGILEMVGRGGMGTVYVAERADGQYRQRVALKVFRRDLDEHDLRRRFLAERQILARLVHPGIARLLDGGIAEDGRPWFALELVDGRSIDAYCAAHALGVGARVALFRAVCEAVQYAHRNLIVHRDLKPSNILVTDDGVVKLLDFGIAKLLDDEGLEARTRADVRLLTPEYASPEQSRGEPITTASDVYQLGIVLHELLTGTRPVEGAGAAAALPTDLRLILLAALRDEPDRRYASAAALDEDLRRWMEGLPVAARPDSLRYRAARFVGRHRVAVTGATAAAVTVLAFGIATAVQSRQIARERDRAERVSALLVRLFETADPTVAAGDTVTVRSVLETGTARVREELADEPALRADLLATIGTVYTNLGLALPASRLHEEALDIRRRTLDARHPDVVRSLASTGVARVGAGDPTGGLALLAEAYDLARRVHGARSLETAAIGADYGYALQVADRLDEARPLLENAVAIHRASADGSAELIARVLNNLGSLNQATGQAAAAEADFREALALRRTLFPPIDPRIANSIQQLAQLLAKTGQLAEADSLARAALDMNHRLYTGHHERIAEGLATLADLRTQAGELEAADSLRRASLDMRRALFGDDHLIVARGRNDYAVFLLERGRIEESIAHFTSALDVYRRSIGDDKPRTNQVRANLADALLRAGRPADALPLARSAIEHLGRAWPPDDPRLARTLVDYGIALIAAGSVETAEPYLRRAYDLERAHRAETDERRLRAQNVLAAALLRLGRYAEAETLLLDSYGIMRAARGEDDAFTRGARATLARLYELWGRPVEAARYRTAGGAS